MHFNVFSWRGEDSHSWKTLLTLRPESVQVIARLRCAGNAPDARRRADGDSGEAEKREAIRVEWAKKFARTIYVGLFDTGSQLRYIYESSN